MAALGKHGNGNDRELLSGQALLHPAVDLCEVGQAKLTELLAQMAVPLL